MSGKLISNDVAISIINDLDLGLKQRQVSSKYGVSIPTIVRVVRKHKLLDLRVNSYNKVSKVFGFGVNDADYCVSPKINGKQVRCEIYCIWLDMLRRCYDPLYINKQLTYINCTVHMDWLKFSVFRSWVLSQDYLNKHLDKDLLNPGNLIYSEENCLFVTSEINGVVVNNHKLSKKEPCGVFMVGSKYISKYAGAYLGTFETEVEASKVYKNEKEERFNYLISTQKDSRIIDGLIKHKKLIWR